MCRDRRRLRPQGTVYSNHRRRPAPHQAHPQNYYLWAALGGVLMAAGHAVRLARLEGTGANLLSDALAGRAGGTFAAKALLTIACLGLGCGGEITPTFTVGARR
ncbi:MAG: chloride channel protein [Adlercreutzia equolifaciens]